MPQHLKKQSKHILYTARKKTNISSKDVCYGNFAKLSSVQRTLKELKEKGLLFQDNVPLRGNTNKVSVCAVYWLTPEGIKIADEIVKEIDEYKRW